MSYVWPEPSEIASKRARDALTLARETPVTIDRRGCRLVARRAARPTPAGTPRWSGYYHSVVWQYLERPHPGGGAAGSSSTTRDSRANG